MPLRPHLPEGWYLVYWRAISVDGHPVQGAFTYAVGPNPGPAPQFPVPKVSATAATPQLLIARWVMFVSVMSAIGLFVLRLLVARPLVRRVRGSSLRPLTVALAISSVVGLIAIPVYLDFSTANDSLRSVFDVGALVPLFRVTAFGRAIVDFELCFALFCVAAWIAVWVDRPDREHRSIAGLVALTGALHRRSGGADRPRARRARRPDLAARSDAAVRLGPPGLRLGLDGRAAGTAGDLAHRSEGPARAGAVGGRPALLERRAGLGHPAGRHRDRRGDHSPAGHQRPVGDRLRKGMLVKAGLLIVALGLAAGNLLRTKPQLASAKERSDRGEPAASLLNRLVSGEAIVVAGAVFAAAVLSSLPPPPPAFAEENSAIASVGPGHVAKSVSQAGYRLQVLVAPNKAAAPNSFALRITKNGQPVRGANVTLAFNHLEMEMPQQEYQLKETKPGIYSHSAPALVMVGRWGLTFNITPKSGQPFTALIVDQANG